MSSSSMSFAGVAFLLMACSGSDKGPTTVQTGQAALRIVNAYTQPVDVLVDGSVALTGVLPATVDTVQPDAGNHAVALRASGSISASLQVQTESGTVRTVAAMRSGTTLAISALDDTNAIVPPGATKVRVLHFAPNAGEIQVFRTQPDWSTPVEWQFPFLYDSLLTDPLDGTYYQSTVGTWDIRAWRKPSEVSLGWDGTTARASFTLASGEKRTVLVLDKPGGGIQLSVIE